MSQIQPYPGTYQDIERVADSLRESVWDRAEMDNRPFLRMLIQRTGGRIKVAHDPSVQEAEGGSLEIRGEKDYTIFLSPYTFLLSDNFTIAHEIGHYVLHFFPHRAELEVPLWFPRYGTGPVEWQANRFAAALLMPQELFSRQFKELNRDLSLLSGTFSVSEDVVEIRAKSLQLLPL